MARWGGRALLRRPSEVEKAAAVMPSRSARTTAPVAVAAAAVTFDDNLEEGLPFPISPVPGTVALSTMEEGGGGGAIDQERHDHHHPHHRDQQQQQDPTPRVLIAAEEARDQEGEQRQRLARSYRCMAEMFSILLLGLVAASASIFVYAWVDAFNEGEFNQALGLISLMFFGTTVCAWASRRRLALATQLRGETLMELSTPLPKGVPPHARRNYHYFTFNGAAKSEANTSTESSVLSFRSQQRTPESLAMNSAAGGRCRKNCSGPVPTASVADEGSNNCAAMGCAPLSLESKEEGQHERRRGIDEAKEQDDDHQQLTSCSWAPSALIECSVCLKGYRGGDKMCRLPCAHAFHAACIDAWLDLHHKCPQCRVDLLTSDIDWETRSENSTAEHPAVLSAVFSPHEAGSVPLPVPSHLAAANNTAADTTTANMSPDAPGMPIDSSQCSPSPLRTTVKAQAQLSPRSCRGVDRVATIAETAVAAPVTCTLDTTKTPARASTWGVTAPNEDGSGDVHPPYPSRKTEPTESHLLMADSIADTSKQPATTSYVDHFCDSSHGDTSHLSVAATTKGQLLPRPEGAATCSTSTSRFPKDGRDILDVDCDKFAAVTEFNTAVNATTSARWPEAAAPFACYIGSPYTPSPPSGTSMKYQGSPPEAGEHMPWATNRAETGLTQLPAGPYASYIDSVCAFSPSPREAMARLQNVYPEGAPYARDLRWPFSPQQSLSDSDMGSSECGEEFSWKTGVVGVKMPQSQVAPYARYLDSPCTPSPTSETVLVRTRGASTPAAAYSFNNNACLSPSLSGGSVVNVRLSPEFVRMARSRAGSRALTGTGDSAFSMFSPPVRSYPSLPLPRQFSREIDGSTTGGRRAVVGTQQQRQRDDLRDRCGHQSQAGLTSQDLDDGAAPPPPPPRLVSRQPLAVRQSGCGGLPPSTVQSRGSSFSSSYSYGGERNGGGGRGANVPSRPSARLLVMGNTNASPAAGKGVGKDREWPPRASMWGNNARSTAGGSMHIEPLNEDGEGGQVGEGRRREEEGRFSTNAREAWEHGRQGSVKQQQQRQQQQHERRLHEQYLRQQFARSFDEGSIAETEEDDDQLWDRVQYWFQV